MHNEDATINSFVIYHYKRKDNLFIIVTDTVAQTIINIIDSFIQLYEKKDIGNISVKEIACRAGYSRTTFYTYFRDTYDVLETIEDLVLLHTETYAPLYYQMYSSNDYKEALELSARLVSNYAKYLKVLLLKNKVFVAKYKESIKKIFAGRISGISGEKVVSKDYLEEALSSAIVDMFIYWFKREDRVSVPTLLSYGREIFQLFRADPFNYREKLSCISK